MSRKPGIQKKIETYQELWSAYKKQVTALIQTSIPPKNLAWQLISEFLPSPFMSSLFEGCIENGKDISKSGKVLLTTSDMWVAGIPSVGDSLAAGSVGTDMILGKEVGACLMEEDSDVLYQMAANPHIMGGTLAGPRPQCALSQKWI